MPTDDPRDLADQLVGLSALDLRLLLRALNDDANFHGEEIDRAKLLNAGLTRALEVREWMESR